MKMNRSFLFHDKSIAGLTRNLGLIQWGTQVELFLIDNVPHWIYSGLRLKAAMTCAVTPCEANVLAFHDKSNDGLWKLYLEME
jgi:hypothetical protein